MLKKNLGTLTRFLGLLAILALGAMQQPAPAMAESQPCGGVQGCWACVTGHPDGGSCIVFYCDGFLWTDCF